MTEPSIPQKMPYVLEVDPGKYAWCSCGKSQKQPYCDGAHRGSEFKPTIEEISEKKRVAWCGCKKAASGGPFCDGSHSKL